MSVCCGLGMFVWGRGGEVALHSCRAWPAHPCHGS